MCHLMRQHTVSPELQQSSINLACAMSAHNAVPIDRVPQNIPIIRLTSIRDPGRQYGDFAIHFGTVARDVASLVKDTLYGGVA